MPICHHCGKEFAHTTKYKAKTCSTECKHAIQSAALREHRPPPRPKRGRSKIAKQCPLCGSGFEVTTRNRRKTYCSPSCAATAIQQKNKIQISEGDLQSIVTSSLSYIEAAEILKVAPYTMYRRMKELGIKREKKPLKIRPDGYWNYRTVKNHRRIMEEHLGYKLLPKQGVHHVDGIKTNNNIDNLIVTDGTSEHSLIHDSLEKCALELFRQGIIGFNRDTKRYFIKTP